MPRQNGNGTPTITVNATANAPTNARTQAARGRTVIPLNQALNRAVAREVGTRVAHRGTTVNSKRLEHVLQMLYNNNKFRGLDSFHFLENLTTYVHQSSFDSAPDCTSKIKKVLQLVDALWTEEERNHVKTNGPPDGRNRAYTIFNHVTQRVKQCAHVVKDGPKRTSKFSPRSGDGILGLSNNVKNHLGDIRAYIPKWDKPNNPRQSLVSLQDVINGKTQQLEQRIRTQRLAASYQGNRQNSNSDNNNRNGR